MAKLIEKLKDSVHRCKNVLCNVVDAPVVVLTYHRVSTLASDPEMLAVTPENFRAQLKHLIDGYPVLRFEDDWANSPKPAVVITFDDGYADNALEALPILEEVGVPATFFVSTGNIGTARQFWWNELEGIILGARALPAEFTLEQGSAQRSWSTGTEGQRSDFYQELVQLMIDADTDRRDAWLCRIRDWAGRETTTDGRHRSMTVEELRRLAASEFATIGAHSASHSRLASLAAPAQREEITASKRQLEAWLDREVALFSYPFGKRGDYTEETAKLCREAGFAKAAANFPGQAHRWTDPFQIPRQLVRNWPAELFAQKLTRFWRS